MPALNLTNNTGSKTLTVCFFEEIENRISPSQHYKNSSRISIDSLSRHAIAFIKLRICLFSFHLSKHTNISEQSRHKKTRKAFQDGLLWVQRIRILFASLKREGAVARGMLQQQKR